MMKKSLYIFFILIIQVYAYAQVNRPVGINICGLAPWWPELVFTDAFKQSNLWVSYNADGTGPSDTHIDIPLNERDYPLQIPYDDGVNPSQIVRSVMLWFKEYAIPKGQYRLIVKGTGQVELNVRPCRIFNCPVDTYVEVTDRVILKILSSDVNDPISDIKLILPKYTETFQDKKFTDEFLTLLSDFQIIRFTEFTKTNFSDVETWDQRGKYNYYTQSQSEGVAWEYVIELCNLLQKDAWINIPHKADDNYILQLATLFHEQLDENLKIYLEYSNEVWNGWAFEQHHEAAKMAKELGYSGKTDERAWKFTAKRSADIFDIFERVFTDDNRLIKIIPLRASTSMLSDSLMTYFNDPLYNPKGISADALAIAPYFGFGVVESIVKENVVESITIEEIIDRMEAELAIAFNWMSASKAVADKYSLSFMCYEGGQHVRAKEEYRENDILIQKLIDANHHIDLQDVYCQYLNYWYENNGQLFNHCGSHTIYSKEGCFGLKDGMFDMNNPKYQAFQECVFAYNDTIATEINPIIQHSPSNENTNTIFPNPAGGSIIIKGANMKQIKVNSISGTLVYSKNILPDNEEISIDISSFKSGIYLLQVMTNNGVETNTKIIKE